MPEDTNDELPSKKGKKGRKGGGMIPLVLVALLAGGAAGAAGGIFMADRALAGAPMAGAGNGGAEAPASAEPDWALFALDNLVVNPAGTQGRRFLIVSASIEVDPDRALPSLERSDARLRDGILRALGAWGVEELTDAARRPEIEALVQGVARDVVGDAPVGRVYFSQFLLQ
jgi:flagellar FliL protein